MIEFKVVTTPRQDRFEESVVALLNDGIENKAVPK